MAINRVGSSILSAHKEAVLNKVLKAGEFAPESKFVTATIGDVLEVAKSKRKIGFFETAKKRIKTLFADFRRSKKAKRPTKPTEIQPGKAYSSELTTQKRAINAQTGTVRSKRIKPKINKLKTGIQQLGTNIARASRTLSAKAGKFMPFIFTKEGIKAAHRYLDTVMQTTIKRQAAEIKSTAVRKFFENRLDYKRCLSEFQEALKAYYKAVKKGDKVNLSFAKSRLEDSKTSLEIAAKYMKLSAESCKNMAA